MNPTCSHGKKWSETCLDCEEVSLTQSIQTAELNLKRDKRQLKAIQKLKAAYQSTRTRFQCIARCCEGCLVCEDKNDQATGNLLNV